MCVRDVSVGALDVGTVGEKPAAGVEIPSLQPESQLVGQRFALMDVHHAEPAEIAILRVERSVDDVHAFHKFGAKALERPKVSLTVTLRTLILLDVVHQHFQSAVDAAVIQIKSEASDLQRFAAAFVLSGVDPRVQDVKNLIVA